MKLRSKKKDASQNQAWLDWLNDDTPTTASSGERGQPTPPSFNAPNPTATAKRPGVRLDGFAQRPGANSGFPRSQRPAFTPQKPTTQAKSLTQASAPVPPTLNWRATTPKQASTKRADDADKDIAINIHLPQFKLPKVRVQWTQLRWILLALAVIMLLVGGNAWLAKRNEAARLAQSAGSDQPSYAPLKPSSSDKSNVDSSSVYNAKQQLYKYNDTYLGSNLTVSQQPLPDDLKQHPEKLAKIAEQSIGATDSFDTTNGKVYIATSEGGYQRLVLVHRQLLVFITSPQELQVTDWVTYIQSLE